MVTRAEKRAYHNGWRKANRDKVRKYAAAYRVKNPGLHRKWQRKRWGLPEPTRPEPAMCENCAWPSMEGKSLCLDHDHVTGQFRGWLCHRCNAGIGLLGDNIASLRSAVAYLEKHA
jgi:Recombination endonuclease VII